MSDIKDKLKKLLAEQPLMTGADLQAQRAARVEQARPEPRSPADRLRDLLDRHGAMGGGSEQVQRGDGAARYLAEEFEIDKVVQGEIVGEEDECFYLVREDFPVEQRQGNVPLGAVLDVIPEHIALSACDAELEEFDPATTLFMDTETTGLAGGTGTVAFLVGMGYFTGEVFRLEQCFMRDYDEEEPMLRYLDGLFQGCETVVSYNGKSFDIPLLRTRFLTNRMRFRLDGAMHFDLVHAARRFWKERLGDCSLGNIERAVLGLERHGDVPSAEIPQIWFDYLISRDARALKRVFYHHKMDVLSLVALTGLLSERLEVPDGRGFEHVEDRLSLVRLHFRQRRFEDVVRHARSLLEAETSGPMYRECLELLAYALKRLQNWGEMEETWALLMQKYPKHVVPRLELAKHYEHRKRDLPAAERLCVETLQFLETRAAVGHDPEVTSSFEENFRYRLERIRRKRTRTRPRNEGV